MIIHDTCSSVSSMLYHLQWPTLENRHTYLKLRRLNLVDTNINLTPLDSATHTHEVTPIATPFPSSELKLFLTPSYHQQRTCETIYMSHW